MKLLLDTHAALWFLGGSPRLTARARSAIEDASNTRLFSVAGAWEIAIKVGLGRLTLAVPFQRLVPGELQENAIELLPILPEHLVALLQLPHQHRDPFDRLIVAQTLAEGATLVTADPLLQQYGVPVLW